MCLNNIVLHDKLPSLSLLHTVCLLPYDHLVFSASTPQNPLLNYPFLLAYNIGQDLLRVMDMWFIYVALISEE